MDIKSFESYDVSGDYYNLKDKLGLYVLNRSKECFERAEKKRAEIKTKEELNLVASVIPYLINVKGYDDIDVELINKECSKQIEAYSEN